MTNNTEITVEVTAMAVGGAMIGTIVAGPEVHLGKKAFVADALPGEIVIAEITKEAKGHVEARLLRIEKPASQRITPDCDFAKDCGGCQLWHIPIGYQRELKLDMVKSLFRIRGLKVEKEVSLQGVDLPDRLYRNRVTLHLSAPDKIGFYKRGTGDVVAINKCLIASTAINQALEQLHRIKFELCGRVPSLILEDSGNEVIAICKLPHDAPKNDITLVQDTISSEFPSHEIRVGRKTVATSISGLNVAHGHFQQVNNAANKVLIDTVANWLSGNEIDDLYAGSGNLSMPLARPGISIRAVEFDASLVRAGNGFAIAKGVGEYINFIQQSCERFAKNNKLRSSVILDPPRAGAKQVVRYLNPADTQEIVYVSCSLATFVRDALVLQSAGYRLIETGIIDMFPQTHHLELVSRFAA